MTISDEENCKAKMSFITAFFDDLDRKIEFLLELSNSGHGTEATLLCSCYIDSLALALYWPEEKSNFCFVRILKEYGGEEFLLYIHPKMLEEALAIMNHKWLKVALSKILPILQKARGKLYNDSEMIDMLSTKLTKDEQEKLGSESWRETLAAIAYSRIRVPSVHGFGAPNGISFDNTTFRGQPVPTIGFSMLYVCLKRIASAVCELSLSSEKWFGHDFKRAK
jgi:hypothetical protein